MKRLLFILILLVVTWALCAQSSNTSEQTNKGNWLLSRVSSDKQAMNASIETAIRSGLMPQAMERNEDGVFLMLSQTTPPARFSKSWQLLRYASERKLMEEMRALAQEDWTPIAMDVQDDGAFVQYVKNGLRITNARMIRISQSSEIQDTVQVYRDLGFFPAALSTYKDELWFLFAQYENMAVEDFEISIKSGDAVSIEDIIEQGLASEKTQFIDMAITVDNQVIIAFIEPITQSQ